jgi:hypothetical protein
VYIVCVADELNVQTTNDSKAATTAFYQRVSIRYYVYIICETVSFVSITFYILLFFVDNELGFQMYNVSSWDYLVGSRFGDVPQGGQHHQQYSQPPQQQYMQQQQVPPVQVQYAQQQQVPVVMAQPIYNK